QEVTRFEAELIDLVGIRARETFDHFRSQADFPEELQAKLRKLIEEFKAGFRAGEAARVATPRGPDVVDTKDAVSGEAYG
ncbi:MAG: hypothetical protein ACRD0D_13420, partial [Acidimicrobiales bacterium]